MTTAQSFGFASTVPGPSGQSTRSVSRPSLSESPARTTVITGLPRAEMLVEIDALAVLD